MIPESIYSDGGVIGRNPSRIGGTWAWLWIANGEIIASSSGVVTPTDLKVEVVTNNQTELIAALRALANVPKEATTTLYTDSLVTLRRLCVGNAAFTGVPKHLRDRARSIRSRTTLTRRIKVALIGGHPNRAELAAGAKANGTPVSRWNVWCDEECSRLAKAFLTRIPLDEKPPIK